MVSSNVRGFHTNVGELTHRFVHAKKADVVFVTETFLNDSVPASYARIKGYSPWYRKDRSSQGGGVALCHKASLNLVVLDTFIPAELEVIIFKIIGDRGRSILCLGCYRPPGQDTALVDFITDNVDRLMTTHNCENVVILGDLNPPGIRNAFDSLLTILDLQNHVTFPTHRSGSCLDPVITDFPSHEVNCSSLGPVGSSDHEAILARINFERPREECVTRTLWLWEVADWANLRRVLHRRKWECLLQGDVDQQVERFTEVLLREQRCYVPQKQHSAAASDQPWFGPQCRAASDAKYKAWCSYKRRPTWRNRQRHREAATTMEDTENWARHHWIEDKKKRLKGGNIGSKQWWSLVKDCQGELREPTIPPLHREDGDTASSSQEKVDLLARHFI